MNPKSQLPLAVICALLLPAVKVPMQQTLISDPAGGVAYAAETSSVLDSLILGDAASELAHGLKAAASETLIGGLGQLARRFLPLNATDWQGGSMSFTVKVDPVKPNYFTIKQWGEDVSESRMYLYFEGKLIGYRHLGDVPQLDFGATEPGFPGRFIYQTVPLPLGATQGKTQIELEVRSGGRIWGYGQTFDKFQRVMTAPTRAIYRIYTHTDAHFVPPAGDPQGSMALTNQVRQSPGPEVLEAAKARVNQEIAARLKDSRPLDQMQLQLLAKAYDVKWTLAYRNPRALERIGQSLDDLYLQYQKKPALARADPATWNADWYGLGPSGQAIALRAAELTPFLDGKVPGTGTPRRTAFTQMLVDCRDWHRRHRRLYTNQTMINDLYGIYLPNKGIRVLDASQAMPEPQVMRYLYESVGLEAWRDSDPGGSAAAETNGKGWNIAPGYMEVTSKGLTRELGYVGGYGEVLDWVNDIYNATKPQPHAEGDPKIKAQLLKLASARAIFRHPGWDAQGNRVMRLEQVIGWRDEHYPGDVVYGQRMARDSSALQTAANTLDAKAVGYAQQMLEDNQFFANLEHQMQEKTLRVTIGLMDTPDEYELVRAQPPSKERLPMSWGQPDLLFSDEEDGVLGLKRGDEILYISLYWRARNAINSLARIHYITPAMDRIAVVREDAQFEPSGLNFTRPDHTNFSFLKHDLAYPGEWHSALAGEKLPIAQLPSGIKFAPGDESVYAGKASFYTLRYGPYLIGMNTTTDKTFDLASPGQSRELVSGKEVKAGQILKVGPRSTAVLLVG